MEIKKTPGVENDPERVQSGITLRRAWVALDEFDNQIVEHIEDSFALLASMTEAKMCLHAVQWCVDHNVETVR
ncbi:unnamed protein product [Camellia sinensis]